MNGELIYLEVNGVPLSRGFESIRVVRTLASIAGTFEFRTLFTAGVPFPIKLGDNCKVHVNGVQVLDGFIETIKTAYSKTDHTITVGGRDKTADVVDSSSPDNLTFETGLSFKNIIQETLKRAAIGGIKVFDLVGTLDPFGDGETVSAEVGEPLYKYFEKYSRLRQVFLTTDGLGNIAIERASVVDTGVSITNTTTAGNLSNVVSSSATFSHATRFNKYFFKSQDNFASLGRFAYLNKSLAKESANIQGDATDSSIRDSRKLTLVAEKSVNKENAGKRALWEKNIRILSSLTYNCTLFGFSPSENAVWKPNTLITVNDEFAQVNTKLLVHTVTYAQSLSEGSTTTLLLVNKDALTLQAEIEKVKANAEGASFGVL